MSQITITKQIHAPVEAVFITISDIRNFSKAISDIINVEFLTDQEYGIGTKFRETRDMNGREASTELEVTELEENQYIRLVSDAGGTIWDSVFTVQEKEGNTELTLTMEARPYNFLAKIAIPFIKGFMKRSLEKDMVAVKSYCEEKKWVL